MSLFTVDYKNPCGTTKMFNNLLGLLYLSQLLSYTPRTSVKSLLELSRTGEFDILGVRRLNSSALFTGYQHSKPSDRSQGCWENKDEKDTVSAHESSQLGRETDI